jgi:hypothetical protein
LFELANHLERRLPAHFRLMMLQSKSQGWSRSIAEPNAPIASIASLPFTAAWHSPY